MSGFVAIVNTDGAPVDRNLLERLTDVLHFRGPDRRKTWIDGAVGFGHTLFKTTAEAQYEHQPSSLSEVWITGSARIDARPELINSLGLQSEIQLDQTPDSDLILHAYHAWGEKCLDHLLGDFAFVIWDKRKRRLFCARDHFGMRQLYYAQCKNCFIVSNTLDCISQHPAVSTHWNNRAIGGFLLFGDHMWLDKSLTVYADIKSLLPAHQLELENGKCSLNQYWDLPDSLPLLRYRKERDYLDHFLEVFKRAISDRIRTDRVVISMSGGMDSTAIAATLCEIQDEGSSTFQLNAVTGVYKQIHPCHEHYFADLVGQRLGLSIEYVVGDQYPFLSNSMFTTRPLEIEQPALLLEIKRKQSRLGRVVLTGMAADNLLRYPPGLTALKTINPVKMLLDIARLRKRYGKLPGFGTGVLKKLKGGWSKQDDRPVAPYPYPSWLNHEFETRMDLPEQWTEMWASSPEASAFRSRGSLLHDSLVMPDWCIDDMLMTCDFTLPEERDPYLDQRMVELILSLPALPWLFKKHILRQAMKAKLPAAVIERPKTPLGMLHHSLLQSLDAQWVDEWRPVLELQQYVDREKIPEIAGENSEPTSSRVSLRPLILSQWLQNTNG